MKCFECPNDADHNHHVIPKILGGTKTVPLCGSCHGKVHKLDFTNHSRLIRLGLEKRKKEGKHNGYPPYGFTVKNDKLIKNDKEYKNVLYILRLRKMGLSLRSIANTLYNESIVSRFGNKFKPTSINIIIKRNGL